MPRMMRTLVLILLLLSPAAMAQECPPIAADFDGVIYSVTSGQTLTVDVVAPGSKDVHRHNVRLFGIETDAPHNWPWGPRAKDNLSQVVQKDTYLRCTTIGVTGLCEVLATCRNSLTDLGVWQAQLGVAIHSNLDFNSFNSGASLKAVAMILDAEDAARAAKRGIWAD